jgi:hypothetical protein
LRPTTTTDHHDDTDDAPTPTGDEPILPTGDEPILPTGRERRRASPPDLSRGWRGVYAGLDVPLPTDDPDPILPAKRRERSRASEQDAARRGADAGRTTASGDGDRRGEVFGL